MIGSISNINLGGLPTKDIFKAILGTFKIPDVPPPPIDPVTILETAKNPGLSPRKIAAEIIARQSEAGAPFGPLPSGADNVAEKMEIIRIQEIIKALQQESRITVSIPPGILVYGFAISPVGPLPVVAQTVSPVHIAYGIIQ